MGSQDNRKAKNSIDGISNTISGDGRKFVGELKTALREFFEDVGDIVKDVVPDAGVGSVEQLTDLSLMEVHVTGKNGAPQSNIQVDFSNANVTNYKEAQVWMKTDGEYFVQVGVTRGVRYIVEDVKADTTYTVKVIAVNKSGGTARFDEAPQKSITIQGSVLVPDAPQQFYLTWDKDGALWEWIYEDNGYVDFFELRLDENAGSYDDQLLDRTRNTYSRVAPPTRSGTAYLFVRNIFGTYSLPATHVFNKQMPAKPNPPVLESTLDGVVITMDGLPSGYQGWILEINGEEFKSYNRQFTYYQFSGDITVKYCFFDTIGNGEWSDEVMMEIKTVIDKDDLPEISYEEFDQSVRDAIDAANGQADINEQIKSDVENTKSDIKDVKTDIEGISADISEIQGKVEENSSAIIQTDSKIETVVTQKVIVAKGEIKGEILDEIGGDIKDEVAKEVGSQVKQEADNITATVYEQVKDEITSEVASQVKIEADKITSTVYTKTEVDNSLANKDKKSDVYTKHETASQISQSAEEVKVLVYKDMSTLQEKVDENIADIKTNASNIVVNTQGITALATSVSEVSGKVDTQASEIKILNDQIALVATQEELNTVSNKVDQNTASIKLTNDSITSVVGKLSGKAEDSGYAALTGLASSIVQTNDSITSVVTELNKSPEECKYSSITQLQDGIDLCVKDEDLNGEEIVSRINLSDGVVTIDGKWVHITGDTVFDDNVIVGGNIAADSITSDHLKMNAVTSAKIAANAITADKINAGAITTEKITDRSVTSVKIEDGAITATKIIDGAVSSTKIEGGAITTEHIQAGSIIGEHISAGAINADKLFAGNIDMTGALALVGGAVKLNENGLTCQMNDGYTVFDEEGITFFNNSGESFAQVRQMCIGTAEHGSTVRFAGTWSEVPSVVCVPTELQIGVGSYTQSDVFMVCGAKNVTKDGFSVQCYTKLGEGASASINFDQEYLFPNDKETIITIGTYNATEASTLSITVSVSSYANTTGDPGTGKDAWYSYKWWSTGHFEFYNDGVLIGSTVPPAILSYPNITSQQEGTVSNINTVVTTVDCVVDGVGELTAKFIPERSKYANTQDLSTILRSIEYNTEGEHIISTGRALFVAMTNSATGYTVTKGGATYGLRNEVRQG